MNSSSCLTPTPPSPEKFLAAPAHRCLAPGMAFCNAQDALQYAREASALQGSPSRSGASWRAA
jgi:hypothetical protein